MQVPLGTHWPGATQALPQGGGAWSRIWRSPTGRHKATFCDPIIAAMHAVDVAGPRILEPEAGDPALGEGGEQEPAAAADIDQGLRRGVPDDRVRDVLHRDALRVG